MMNKNTILSVLLLTMSVSLKAQVMAYRVPFAEVGIKVGANFERLASAPVKATSGFLTGFYVRKQIEKIGIRVEVTGSTSQYTTKYPASFYTAYSSGIDTVTTAKFQVVYVNVPLLLEFSPFTRFNILLGPQFNYMVSIKDKNKAYEHIYGDNKFLTTTDFSIVAGAEYNIGRKIKIGARFFKGITDVNNSTYYLVHKSWTTTGAQISLSYKIL